MSRADADCGMGSDEAHGKASGQRTSSSRVESWVWAQMRARERAGQCRWSCWSMSPAAASNADLVSAGSAIACIIRRREAMKYSVRAHLAAHARRFNKCIGCTNPTAINMSRESAARPVSDAAPPPPPAFGPLLCRTCAYTRWHTSSTGPGPPPSGTRRVLLLSHFTLITLGPPPLLRNDSRRSVSRLAGNGGVAHSPSALSWIRCRVRVRVKVGSRARAREAALYVNLERHQPEATCTRLAAGM